jgi:hypothetical protein
MLRAYVLYVTDEREARGWNKEGRRHPLRRPCPQSLASDTPQLFWGYIFSISIASSLPLVEICPS